VSDNAKPAVVLVDDEDMILTSIRTLLMLESDYEVEAFTNPLDAVRPAVVLVERVDEEQAVTAGRIEPVRDHARVVGIFFHGQERDQRGGCRDALGDCVGEHRLDDAATRGHRE